MASRWPFVGRTGELARAEGSSRPAPVCCCSARPASARPRWPAACPNGHRRGGTPTAPRSSAVIGRAVSSGTPFEAFADVLTGGRSARCRPAASTGRLTAAARSRPRRSRRGHGVGRRRALLLVVDDVDLLDDGSARVLLHLAHAGAAVIATARSAPLPGPVEPLWRDGHCERIELAGLTDDEAGELLETVLGGPGRRRRRARAFASRAQGNPLLLRELVQAALQRSVLVRRDSVWVLAGPPPLSGGVRDLVASQAGRRGRGRPGGPGDGRRRRAAARDVASAMVGEALLIALEEARLVAVRAGPAGPEVSTRAPAVRRGAPRRHAACCGCAGCGWRWPTRWRRRERARARTTWSARRSGGWTAGRATTRSGCWRRPARLAASACETAERLARHAHETQRSLPATLLLAEILTHTGRGDRGRGAARRAAAGFAHARRPGSPHLLRRRRARPAVRRHERRHRTRSPLSPPGTQRPAGICTRCTPRCSRSTPACGRRSRSGCRS